MPSMEALTEAAPGEQAMVQPLGMEIQGGHPMWLGGGRSRAGKRRGRGGEALPRPSRLDPPHPYRREVTAR
ncbi:hypothetical protein ACP70R_032431 [Stipagrostis hirtigluma subsp. patula]